MENTKETEQKAAYVKEVAVADLPSDVRDELPDVETLYGIYDDEGTQLALVNGERLAFSLARENDYQPYALN